jgi:hypothetical protein
VIDLEKSNHTGRELQLMLSGRKPLAVFYAELSELPDDRLIPETEFAPHVASGAFVRGESEFNGGASATLGRIARIRYVFFALHAEQWRIPAFELLLRIRHEQRLHNEAMERYECALLGYTDAETDAWCDRQFRTHSAQPGAPADAPTAARR